MKKLTVFPIYFILIISFIFTAYSNHGWQFEKRITVGKEPVAVLNSADRNNNYNIFCLGYDKNFNGKFDAADGDEAPSWWFFNHDSLPKKVRDFDFGYIGFPFRPAIIKAGNVGITKLYIFNNDRIRSFNYETGELLDDNVAKVQASAISGAGNILYISVREPSKDYVLIYDINQKKALDTIPAYKNVQQTILDGNNLYILCEGNYGSSDSKLIKAEVTDNKHIILKIVNLGDGANHIANDDYSNQIMVTLNGSSEVKSYSKNDLSIQKYLKIPTSGYNGPRESFPYDGYTFTSSYSGKLYFSYYNTIMDSLELFGKGEGIGGFFGMTTIIKTEGLFCRVITATPFKSDSYEPDSNCTIYSFDQTFVNEDKYYTNASIFPNPILDNGKLEVTVDNSLEQFAEVSIFSVHGKEAAIFRVPIIDGSLNLNFSTKELGLSQGFYFARIKSGNYIKTIPFGVIN